MDEISRPNPGAGREPLSFADANPALAPRIWQVGALCRAVADALEARFNPVAVRGEISGFSRAASGHCYFSLKDAQGQLRCAMFRRTASLLDFAPREGDLVEVQGRLAVYEPRGDLQLVVESLRRAGAGTLFEQFLRLKARLEAEGLFDPLRKRPVPRRPRAIGLVTSLGAAALHDVLTCLRRRVPHVPVIVAPAKVQGGSAAGELCAALEALYRRAGDDGIDVILLVRGGGSIEDLWAFNEEPVARAIVRSPVPVVSGVGHETDFTIADFCADLRAPTPTAAAELAALSLEQEHAQVMGFAERASQGARRQLDRLAQRVDQAAAHLGRPSQRVGDARLRLARAEQRLSHALALRLHAARAATDSAQARRASALATRLRHQRSQLDMAGVQWVRGCASRLATARERLATLDMQLRLLDPRLVLRRGYAMLMDETGRALSRAADFAPAMPVRAALADGEVDLTVERARANRP